MAVEGQPILRGVDLTVGAGELHALMGPNGSGKSTLANVLLGNPAYQVTAGRIRFQGEDVTAWPTDVRGKAGHVPRLPVPRGDRRRAGHPVPAPGPVRPRGARTSRCSRSGCR